MIVDGVRITTNLPDLSLDEVRRYVEYTREHVKDNVVELDVRESSDGGVDLNWKAQGEKFERIRRITGYLTGDLTTWNNAKRSEESERVKHAR